MRQPFLALLGPAVLLIGLGHGHCPDAGGQQPNPDIHYQLGPDSLPREGVPKGEVRGPFTLPSDAYPGTQHTYWVYVPAQSTLRRRPA